MCITACMLAAMHMQGRDCSALTQSLNIITIYTRLATHLVL